MVAIQDTRVKVGGRPNSVETQHNSRYGDHFEDEVEGQQYRPTTSANPERRTSHSGSFRPTSVGQNRPVTHDGSYPNGRTKKDASMSAFTYVPPRKVFAKFIPPSARYPEVEMPNRTIMLRASLPPSVINARQPKPSKHVKQSNRFSGQTQGEVSGKNGGKFQGDVLAGRPHGHGQYWVPSGSSMRIQYEGEWVQGMREGYGSMYYWTGETYHGDFVHNKRHGYGRMEYKCGDVYEGQFSKDRKHGMGTQYYANGDCFVGFFINDRREGLGTMYWLSRAKKYEGEWQDDRPCVGSIRAMTEEEEEQLSRERCTTVPISKPLPEPKTKLPLPKLALQAPAQVVFGQAVDVRNSRFAAGGKEGRSQRVAQKLSGTLDNSTMQRLRHSFIALAGGDTSAHFVRPAKIGEVCVLAGLDPAAPEVPVLLRELHEHSRRDGRLSFDDFLSVLTNFRCILE